MITVTIHRDSDGGIQGFSAAGHSGYAPAGEDIVCAAVSALTQTAALGLERLGLKPQVDIAPARMACRLHSGSPSGEVARDARIILGTIVLGLRETARGYPEYIKLNDPGGPDF